MRRRTQQGAAAVEFALIAPFLLLLVFSMVQYGFYFWAAQGGSTATREAARRAAVGDLVTCSEFRAYIRDRIGSLGDAEHATISRTYTNGPGNIDPDVEVGDLVTVRVAFDSQDFNLPFVPFVDDGRVVGTAEARVESVPDAPEVCA